MALDKISKSMMNISKVSALKIDFFRCCYKVTFAINNFYNSIDHTNSWIYKNLLYTNLKSHFQLAVEQCSN